MICRSYIAPPLRNCRYRPRPIIKLIKLNLSKIELELSEIELEISLIRRLVLISLIHLIISAILFLISPIQFLIGLSLIHFLILLGPIG